MDLDELNNSADLPVIGHSYREAFALWLQSATTHVILTFKGANHAYFTRSKCTR